MKHIEKITFLLFFFTSSICCKGSDKFYEKGTEVCKETIEDLASIGISINMEDINKNVDGHRSGLWVEDNGHYVIITNYMNGQKNGFEQIFSRYKNKIRASYLIGYSDNGMRSIILFDEKTGLISLFVDNIETNDDSINYPVNWAIGHSFPFIGYSHYYNPSNGQLESEGYEVFGNDWEINCERVGQWKIYNKDGTFSINDYGGYGGGVK